MFHFTDKKTQALWQFTVYRLFVNFFSYNNSKFYFDFIKNERRHRYNHVNHRQIHQKNYNVDRKNHFYRRAISVCAFKSSRYRRLKLFENNHFESKYKVSFESLKNHFQ